MRVDEIVGKRTNVNAGYSRQEEGADRGENLREERAVWAAKSEEKSAGETGERGLLQ